MCSCVDFKKKNEVRPFLEIRFGSRQIFFLITHSDVEFCGNNSAIISRAMVSTLDQEVAHLSHAMNELKRSLELRILALSQHVQSSRAELTKARD